MKTIGLLGGMSWESSIVYYRIVNEVVRRRLGGLHSAKCLMFSFDFHEIVAMQRAGDWEEATRTMVAAAVNLQEAGAGLIVICTNTMHKMADAVSAALRVPFIHIADPTARKVIEAGIHTIGLLATQFTMEHTFYVQRLSQKHGLNVLVPEEPDRHRVHEIIFGELCRGDIRPESRSTLISIMQGLIARGAQGIILGCTELGLSVGQEHCPVPLFDTTVLHAEAAAELALA